MLQFDAVLELTVILKFSIKLLTTSNERPTQYGPLGQDRPGCQAPWTIKAYQARVGTFETIYILPLPGVIDYKVKFNQV